MSSLNYSKTCNHSEHLHVIFETWTQKHKNGTEVALQEPTFQFQEFYISHKANLLQLNINYKT